MADRFQMDPPDEEWQRANPGWQDRDPGDRHAWNGAKAHPPPNSHNTPEGAQKAGATKDDPATLGYWEDDFSDADDNPDPPRDWIVQNHLLRGSVTCLFGATGEGKSTVAVHWGVSCALDQSRLPGGSPGKFKSPGNLRVSYYALEEDRTEQRRRIRTTLIQFGAKFSDLAGRLISTGCDKAGTLISYDPTCGKLETTDLMNVLRDHITRHRPDVLFLDPMVELHTAPENDNSLLRLVTAMLRALAREFRIAIVLMHHARKGDLTPGDIEALRGAGAIGGAIRFGFTVCPMSESDATQFGIQENRRSYYARIDRAKASYAPPVIDADWFEKISHLDDSGEFVGAFHPWEPPAVQGLSQEVISKLCTAIIKGSPADGQPWSPKLSVDPRSIRNLFAQHNIVGTKAEKAALQTLYSHEVEGAKFKPISNRTPAAGLRIGDLPKANWIEEDDDA
jgi:hypothetical protein